MRRLPLSTSREVRSWIWHTIRTHKRKFGTVAMLSALATIAGLVGPQILGRLVDLAVQGTGRDQIDLLALVFVVALLVRGWLTWLMKLRMRRLGEHVMASTRETFVGTTLALPLGTVESAGTGDLLSRATTDIGRIDRAVQDAVPVTLSSVITSVLTIIAIIVTSPLLASGLLVTVVLLVSINIWYQRKNPTAIAKVLDRWARVQSDVYETAAGARTVEALGLIGKRVHSSENLLQETREREYQQRRLESPWRGCLSLSYVLPLAVILLIGYWAYNNNLLGIGVITTVLLYAQALTSPLNMILLWLENLQVAAAALRRILGVKVEQAPKYPVDPKGQDITVSAVHYEYYKGREVLHGIDLYIPQGERLAIVGPSGAGKSTLGRLLAGVDAPTFGSVRIGQQEVSTMEEEGLRSEVLLLTQEHHVFAGTLRDNLMLPAGQWSDDQLIGALACVGADGWLQSLPDGLDTELGTGAHQVPAATAQQLALARVVLADPHTVVLDEATSLLDTSAARDLERSLGKVLEGRTVIAIAHRLHTAAAADRVAVIEHGRITELGSHTELLAADGPYAQLYHAANLELAV